MAFLSDSCIEIISDDEYPGTSSQGLRTVEHRGSAQKPIAVVAPQLRPVLQTTQDADTSSNYDDYDDYDGVFEGVENNFIQAGGVFEGEENYIQTGDVFEGHENINIRDVDANVAGGDFEGQENFSIGDALQDFFRLRDIITENFEHVSIALQNASDSEYVHSVRNTLESLNWCVMVNNELLRHFYNRNGSEAFE
ncbi:hypothetical protein Q7C36_001954 [Tachysurus vachellii]|uniref:Uncharacterized protein n=1 Tax=Tachysurus vachellii TaxID=175792 RepID=A0AA88NS06_TACVA|nr:hypothetical protein Q7C36_001954 [Tachysurus vachellii]